MNQALTTQALALYRPPIDTRTVALEFAPHSGRVIMGLPGHARFDSLAVMANGNITVAKVFPQPLV